MAPATSSQRITRQKSREISVNLIPKGKLKPRKTVMNKSSKKVNINARDDSLNLSKKNVSLKNNRTPVRGRLRPRQTRKNYCEDSRLLQKFISSKQQDSRVIIEKLPESVKGNIKVPVYKVIKSPEKSSDREDKDIYDFKFDSNDTKEKTSKKKLRKRNVNKEKGKTIKKTTRKKVFAKTTDHKIVESSKIDVNLSTKIIQNDPALEFVTATTSTKGKNMKKIEANKNIQIPKESVNRNIEKDVESSRVDVDNQTIEILSNDTGDNVEAPRIDINIHEATTLPGTFIEQSKKENIKKPRIISIENANNIIVTTSPPKKTEDTQPFRPKNIFDNKTLSKEHNSTLRSSMLIKTLSPILKTSNTFDCGSPWRPPILTFSKTKHFIQSTPYKNFETKKENKKIKKKSIETNKVMGPNKENIELYKENMELNKENIEIDKENIDMNKENIGQKITGKRKRIASPRKKHAIQKKPPISENQTTQKLPFEVACKFFVQPTPIRISLGEIKNVLLRPNDVVNEDNKQTIEPTHTEVNKSLIEQKKKLVDVANFSDTFDMLSESEKISNVENDVPLFMDLEPSHFSKPPRYSYRRKRIVKFDVSEGDSNEEEKENDKLQQKKKKLTKLEKEREKKINNWIKTINSTFQEIEEYDLVIE
ncbi:PREDICTED: uncharacterized protein LOC108776831 [Cyphomyrmex costatus]|uniref:Uncharacterized protein n=1 Tax=Cyphomyrmex costatus TaxID=456900 RepID=A0A151IET6_9HYME|nr:PREDICTED: uncharacterized protein LOC108776831 [Cyphomyrmex costatus]KYM99325.1 hypothetical protein ALC62_09967 [Cyphomyrmex costatus]